MLKKIHQKLGHIANFLSKPFSRRVLNRTRRTRVVIVSGDELVLVKNWLGNGSWSLSGGGINHNETAKDCAVREIEEEIGLKINSKGLEYLAQRQHPAKSQNLTFKIDYFFIKLNSKPNLKVKRPWEITDASWFKLNNLPEQVSTATELGVSLAVKAGLLP